MTLAAVGCGSTGETGDPALSVRLGLSPTPPIQGPTRILVEVEDGGVPSGPGTVRIEGSVSRGAMEPVAGVGQPDGPGRWVVPDYPFSRPGDWVLEVEVRLEDGRSALRRFPVRVTGSAPGSGPR